MNKNKLISFLRDIVLFRLFWLLSGLIETDSLTISWSLLGSKLVTTRIPQRVGEHSRSKSVGQAISGATAGEATTMIGVFLNRYRQNTRAGYKGVVV